MKSIQIVVFLVVFAYGTVIGSFLNVCIFRIPKKESIVRARSHCMCCGYQLRWYDLIPLVSWLVYRGRCRKCGQKLSIQYPLVEALNGCLYMVIFYVNGWGSIEQLAVSILYCLLASALLALSIIDWRTYEIPVGFNIFIGSLGIVRIVVDCQVWKESVIGFFAVSLFLELLFWLSGGRAIGGGDIKLMAAAGLLLGWKKIVLAFAVGCIAGSVIHLSRMKWSNAGKVLAMGPYLSIGILMAALWGDVIIEAYLDIIM